jgi:hypothetical protein
VAPKILEKARAGYILVRTFLAVSARTCTTVCYAFRSPWVVCGQIGFFQDALAAVATKSKGG